MDTVPPPESFTLHLKALLTSIPFITENDVIERIVIIGIYFLIAVFVELVISRALMKLAFKTRIAFDEFVFNFLRRTLPHTVFLLGLLHGFSIDPQLTHPYNFIVFSAIKTGILILWCSRFLQIFNSLDHLGAARLFGKKSVDRDLFYLVKNISRIIIFFLTIVWILIIWRINLTPIFASAGIAGIAIALAAKDTLANFFGGISIYMDRAYKVGEYIILESGERGEVVEVGIRSTKIKTRDDVLITIPNALIANAKIINESAPVPMFRIRIDVGVAYGSDLDVVEDLLLGIAKANKQVVRNPAPRVRLRTFGDSSVDFQLLLWVNDPREKGLQTHNILKAIYKAFEKEGISIPFPQRELYIREKQ